MTEGNVSSDQPNRDPSMAEASARPQDGELEGVPAPEPAQEDAAPDAGDEWPGEVRAALERVLASPDLCTSPRLGAFLRYVVEATLAGRAEQIKGYTIAVEALGRASSFDPQSDPIVRVEATRLRRALQNYYNTVGLADPVLIHIPKGGYVPQFEDRRPPPVVEDEGEVSPAAEARVPAEAAPALQPLPVSAPPVPGRRRIWKRVGLTMAASMVALLALGAGLRLAGDGPWPEAVQAWLGEPPSMADRVRLPIIEVGQFDVTDSRSPPPGDLRSIEERLRDSFAQFDFVDVRARSARGDAAARECSGRQPRSVFSLGGFAEGRVDGSYALLLHLTDRCEGTVVWSHAIDGLKTADVADAEQRVVREIAAALLENYGVVSVRARSQVRAHAPFSGFGCIAEAFAVLRNDGSAPPATPRACLPQLVERDGEFALGHAVRAAALLDEAMRDPAPLPPERASDMLHEAELAVDLAPASAYAARTLALVQLFLGETEAAIASGEQALRLNPLDQDIAATVGTVFIGAGRVQEGEALLVSARLQGAARSPLQETYLAIAAFLRDDSFSAQALVPQLRLHPNPGNRLALALVLHALDRDSDEREAVRSLAHLEGGGPEAVRRLVRHLLPAPVVSERALNALESAGLSQEAATGKRPHG